MIAKNGLWWPSTEYHPRTMGESEQELKSFLTSKTLYVTILKLHDEIFVFLAAII